MMNTFKQPRLGEILTGKKRLTVTQLERVMKTEDERRLGERLIDANYIYPADVAQALAEQFSIPYVDLSEFTVAPDLFELISAGYAYQYNVVPYKYSDGVLQVVLADPLDLSLPDKLEKLCGVPVELLISSPQEIKAALKRSEGTTEVLKDITEDFKLTMIKENDQGEEKIISLSKFDEETGSVVRLVNTLLIAALQKGASDIHVETYDDGIVVKYRIDGVLYSATETLDRQHHSSVVSRIKVMSELDIAEKRLPQDGRFKLRFDRVNIDFRVSILPSAFGEDIVIRILDKSYISEGNENIKLENLGAEKDVLKKIRKAIYSPYGMILITGPTGSGKTTTLYAALSELNTEEEKVITIEDPVEYQLQGIVQVAVDDKKNLTFARGLRSILRHDPDKIMIGEIRDVETAQIAVQSALTGHLVFTTVHANNAFDVIGRFSHMGVDVYNFVSSLNCIMAQRLVRKICPQCKQSVEVDADILEFSGLNKNNFIKQKWYEGKGCENCNGTGYRGRFAITEFLELSPCIREMIIERRPASELKKVAIEEGMVTLRQSAVAKALSGETTLREINRVTFVE